MPGDEHGDFCFGEFIDVGKPGNFPDPMGCERVFRRRPSGEREGPAERPVFKSSTRPEERWHVDVAAVVPVEVHEVRLDEEVERHLDVWPRGRFQDRRADGWLTLWRRHVKELL